MKSWKVVLLIVGILLLLVSVVVYAARISRCYPAVYPSNAPQEIVRFQRECNLDAALTVQFGGFLALFVPGIIFVSAYFLSNRPKGKGVQRSAPLGAFLLLTMFDSLLITVYGLLGYPAPGTESSAASWVVLVVAGLGFLTYISTLALWHWKRWGLALFQGAAIALAVFILLGGGSLVLAGVIIAGVIILSLLLRSMRKQMD
jgi:hypothetical protein